MNDAPQSASTDTSEPQGSGAPMPLWEFIALAASLMALNALAIDIMLPALGLIQDDFGFTNDNDRQLVIIIYLMSFGASQLVFGPLTDRFGRRRVLMITLLLYVIAGLACVFVPTYGSLLAARVLQGIGAGATRVVSTSIVRDLYSGRLMAKIMSMVMMVLMAAPMVAPAIGQGVLLVFGEWRAVFWSLAIYGGIVMVWSYVRLPETLPASARKAIDLKNMLAAYKEILSHRIVCGYVLASGFIYGGLFSYIASTEQIFSDIYDAGLAFPIYIGAAALVMSLANMVNSRLVMSWGMRKLSHTAMIGFTCISLLHALTSTLGVTQFAVFYTFVLTSFFCLGFIGANFSAIAMQPLGALAGTAAAVLGFATTSFAGAIGWILGQTYDGTTAPVFFGHALLGASAIVSVLFVERGRLFQTAEAPAGDFK
ncbi:MAG: multidrug effflux MFS transporter [Pseudomonadota bacterium]